MTQAARTFLQLVGSTKEIPTRPDSQFAALALPANEQGDSDCSKTSPNVVMHFNFMSLPKELRLAVYEFAALPTLVTRGTLRSNHWPRRNRVDMTFCSERVNLDLLYASRQIAFEASEIFRRSFLTSRGCFREVVVDDAPPELTAENLGDFMGCVMTNLDKWYPAHEPAPSDIDRLLHILQDTEIDEDAAEAPKCNKSMSKEC